MAWVRDDATTWRAVGPLDLVVVAYLQVAAGERRAAHRNAVASLRPGGTFLLVAHDSTNLHEGTGGPQDPSVLMTAADVLADLDGYDVEVVRAGRVAREVAAAPGGDHQSTAASRPVRRGTASCGSSGAASSPPCGQPGSRFAASCRPLAIGAGSYDAAAGGRLTSRTTATARPPVGGRAVGVTPGARRVRLTTRDQVRASKPA